VGDDECAERTSLANRPGLVSSASVVRIQQDDSRGVDRRDGQGDLVIEGGVVDVVGNGKRVLEGEAIVGRRNQWRRGVWRELEDGPRGQVACDEGGTGA
jgi:hypothetical protein